jgi:hypothetical protein
MYNTINIIQFIFCLIFHVILCASLFLCSLIYFRIFLFSFLSPFLHILINIKSDFANLRITLLLEKQKYIYIIMNITRSNVSIFHLIGVTWVNVLG